MSSKIDSDVERFKNIIKKRVKNNLSKYITSEHMLGQRNGKSIKIPVQSIDLPRFSYGSPGGVGQGSGDEGDPIDGVGKPKNGKSGKAGNEQGEHEHSIEFTTDELAAMLKEELQLPDIQDKGKGKIPSVKNKYTAISHQGPEGLRSFKRTYKQGLKRAISSGTYNPADPIIIPIKDDRRYRSAVPESIPNVNTVVLFVMDVSGSMSGDVGGQDIKQLAKSLVFLIDLWLTNQYKNIETRFIVHDMDAEEVDREQFFNINESGGTCISNAYQFCAGMMSKEYPSSEWNVYVVHVSDGDSWGEEDNSASIDIIKNKIIPNCNQFSYAQINTASGSGEFMKWLALNFSDVDKVALHQISGPDDTVQAIKTFFGKGK